jgi:protein-tyrosine phosphatase
MQNTPVPDSYWLIPGKLLAGEYPGARHEAEARRKLRAFLAAGITCFLDLTEETEELQPYAQLLSEEAANLNREIVYRRLAIRDLNVPSVELMREIQQVIGEALEKGHVVYAHCWGGIGRTGTVIGCYLVEQGMSGEEALAEIERLRRNTPDGHRVSPETAEQTAFVKQWRQKRARRSRMTIFHYNG